MSPRGAKFILDKINNFTKDMYGTTSRLKDPSQVNMAITAQSFVFSFVPVDVKGFYYDAQVVEVPIAHRDIWHSFVNVKKIFE